MTSRPPGTGASDVWTNGVDLPRGYALDAYEQTYMRGPVPDVNYVYGGWEYLQNPADPNDVESGNFGGNLEVSPPTANFPLGLLTIGNTMDDAGLLAFLKRQRLQVQYEGDDWSFGVVDTSWLFVGHVDEIMCYVSGSDGTQGFKIVYGDPERAKDLLNSPLAPADTDVESYATLFYDGTHEEAGSVTAQGADDQIIDNTKNFPALVDAPTNYQFVRIYSGTGAGQVANCQPERLRDCSITFSWETDYMTQDRILNDFATRPTWTAARTMDCTISEDCARLRDHGGARCALPHLQRRSVETLRRNAQYASPHSLQRDGRHHLGTAPRLQNGGR